MVHHPQRVESRGLSSRRDRHDLLEEVGADIVRVREARDLEAEASYVGHNRKLVP